MAFDISSIRRGPQHHPPRIVVYGEHGLGKSTFGASAPNPIFIPTEDGLGSIDTASFPLAKSYQDIRDAIGTLYREEHGFETVILDSLDWAESLIQAHVARQHGEESIESFGYGKGYVFAADAVREMLDGLNALRLEKSMAVILTAHCEVKRFDDPASESYDRYRLKLHKHAGAIVQEWADVVAFATMKTFVSGEDVGFNKKAKRAISTGERVMHLSRAPAYDAKNRYGMPDTLPLKWSDFAGALRNSNQMTERKSA